MRLSSRGAQVVPAATSGGWTLSLNGGAAGTVTQDGTGIHFSAANNLASVFVNPVNTEDNVTYEITYTITGLTGGGVRVLISGLTLNHGYTGTTRNANGTYTERGTTDATNGSTRLVRIQATGATGTNTFNGTDISVTRVNT